MISTAVAPVVGTGAVGTTAGIAAGPVVIAGLAAKGAARHTAELLVQQQDRFTNEVLKPAAQLAQTDPQGAQSMVAQAWPKFLETVNQFASSPLMVNSQVVQQMFQTPQFMNTVQSLLGDNPLDAKYISTVGATNPKGNIISRIVSAIVPSIATGLQQQRNPLQTPGINPNAKTPQAGAPASGSPGAPSPASPGGFNIGGLSAEELAILGLSAAGGALSNRPQTSTQVTTPVESPEYAGLGAALRQTVQSRLNQPLPPAYETNGIKTINDTYGSIAQGLHNQLTSRGLSSSPVAGNADTNLALRRGGDIVNFQNNLPLVQNDLQNQNIAQAMQLYNSGRGTSSTGRTSGNVVGGAFSDTATALGYLMRQRQLKAAAAGTA